MSTATSASKAKAKAEAAKAAAVAEQVAPERLFTPEEMELLGLEPETEGPKDDETEGPKDDETEGPKDDETEGPKDDETEPDTEPQYAQLWRGGRGVKQHYVVATSEEDAIKKLIEKDSILGAIGCTAEVIDNIDGYTIVAAK